jgi:microcystin-dependent protein
VPQASTNTGTQISPQGGVWAGSAPTLNEYANVAPSLNMDPGAIGSAGGSQPHDNMVPFLAVNFILSLFGIFPSQT